LFAASDELDLRSVMPPGQTVQRASGGNILQRMIAAFRSGY
jgi:hypothetical protein